MNVADYVIDILLIVLIFRQIRVHRLAYGQVVARVGVLRLRRVRMASRVLEPAAETSQRTAS